MLYLKFLCFTGTFWCVSLAVCSPAEGHHDGFSRATMGASRLSPGFGCWKLAFHDTLIKVDPREQQPCKLTDGDTSVFSYFSDAAAAYHFLDGHILKSSILS